MALSKIAQKTGLLVLTMLVLLILPFLAFESTIAAAWSRYQTTEIPLVPLSVVIVGLLASDIFLPIPSSVVATYAGARLGAALGTGLVWLGLTLGAVVGFGLGRWSGPSVVPRLGSPEEIATIRSWQARWGPSVVVLARAVPLLAEATVVLAGLQGMSWSLFLPVVMFSNLGLAIAYAMLGAWAEQREWLPMALAVSAALPLLLAAGIRARFETLR